MHNRFSEFYSFMTSDFTTNSLCYLFLSDAVAMNHAFQSFLNFFCVHERVYGILSQHPSLGCVMTAALTIDTS